MPKRWSSSRRGAAVVAVAAVLVTSGATGCFGKPLARTAADFARVVCEEAVAGHVEILQGKTAQELCALDDVLQPFLDEVLAAKTRGLQKLQAQQVDAGGPTVVPVGGPQ